MASCLKIADRSFRAKSMTCSCRMDYYACTSHLQQCALITKYPCFWNRSNTRLTTHPRLVEPQHLFVRMDNHRRHSPRLPRTDRYADNDTLLMVGSRLCIASAEECLPLKASRCCFTTKPRTPATYRPGATNLSELPYNDDASDREQQ